ncbi:MAG: phage integrase SAM-like domain-containing protein [Planctomycetes bacterium]|nr:phage integrase SAM-like domain-containing protein [Planctomycetota bacterium]
MLNLLEEILRPQRLRDLTPERLSYFQSELRKADDDGKARSENTIASYLKMLRAVLGWAVEMGMLAEIPKIKKPKRATASGKGRAKSTKGRRSQRRNSSGCC